MGECSRPRCTYTVYRQALCRKHYESGAVRGYVPAEPVYERIKLLRSRGYGLRELSALTGLSEPVFIRPLGAGTVQARTAAKIMGVPVPETYVAGGACVPAVGTHRRIKALVAIGYPQVFLAKELGLHEGRLAITLRQQHVLASTAAKVAELYDRLSGTPGPSNWSRSRARKRGYASPLAWDEGTIDDPDAEPNFGEAKVIYFKDRYADIRQFESNRENIARRLGMSEDSLERMLTRYRLKGAS